MPTVHYPPISEIDTRDGSLGFDALHMNALIDLEQQQPVCRKRPGFTFTEPTYQGVGQGIYVNSTHQYEVVSGALYQDGVFKANIDLTDLTSIYSFTDSGNLTTTPFITFHGDKPLIYKWVPSTNTLTNHSIAGQATGNLVSGYVQLDGAFYVMDSIGNIWGSDILDPSTWSALNKIVMPLEDGAPVGIYRRLSHIVALGTTTIATFLDAGNPEGSPLQQATNYFRHNGGKSGADVVVVNDDILLVTTNRTGYSSVVQLQGNEFKEVSTPGINKILNYDNTVIGRAYALDLGDRYLFCLNVSPPPLTEPITLCYDNLYKIWYYWQFSTTTVGEYLPGKTFTQSTTDSCTYYTTHVNTLNPNVYTYISYTIGTDILYVPVSSLNNNRITIRIPFNTNGASFIADVRIFSPKGSTSSNIVSWSKGVVQTIDATLMHRNLVNEDILSLQTGTFFALIPFRVRTNDTDFGSLDLKHILNLDILADMTNGGVYFRVTLDNYQTYMAWRYSNLQARVRFSDLGAFERMAIDVFTLDAYPFRLKRIDVRIE